MDGIIAFALFFVGLMGLAAVLRVCRILFRIMNRFFDNIEGRL